MSVFVALCFDSLSDLIHLSPVTNVTKQQQNNSAFILKAVSAQL